jgi:DnaJ-class molecular chaperone
MTVTCWHCLGTGRLYLNIVGLPCPGCGGNGVIEAPKQGEKPTLTPIDTNDESKP